MNKHTVPGKVKLNVATNLNNARVMKTETKNERKRRNLKIANCNTSDVTLQIEHQKYIKLTFSLARWNTLF